MVSAGSPIDPTAPGPAEASASVVLRALLSATTDAYVALDAPGTVTGWSPAAATLLGWSAAEALGRSLTATVLPGPTGARADAALGRLRAGNDAPMPLQGQARHRDGRSLAVELVIAAVRLPDGWEFHLILRNVTARRAVEDRIGNVSQVVESSADAILTVDLRGRITSWNRSAELLYGLRAADVLDRDFPTLVGPEGRGELADLARAVLQTSMPQQADIRCRQHGGPCIDVALTLAPLFDATAGQIGYSATARDIGSRLRMQERARRNEEVFRKAFDTSLTGMVLTGIDGRLRRVNPAFAQMLGRGATELVGTYHRDLVAPENRQPPPELARALAGEIEGFATDRCYLHADGSRVWVESLVGLVRDAAGAPSYLSTQTIDVTTSRELRRERDTRDLMLRAVIANSSSLISVKDLEGRYLLTNEPFARAVGRTEAQLLGSDDSCIDPLVAAAWRQDDERARREEFRVEEETDGSDGRHCYESVKFPLRDTDGTVYATCAVSMDMTPQRRAAEAMTLARDEALAATAAKSAFLATMSHEIRTPLNAVIGMTELLLETALEVQQREFAETVRDSGEALLVVINDVLDFSKIESGELELAAHPFSLRECVESAVAVVAVAAGAKGLELVSDVDRSCPELVAGDVNRFRQVLVHLLGNAVKFTAAGEVVVVASVPPAAAVPDGTVRVEVAVRDTGIGIPPDRLERMFDSFSQADSSTTRVYGGTGLGLAISRRLAAAMRGELVVDSRLGVGSTFTFRADLGRYEDRRAARPADAPVSFAGRSALIVDDNATNRRVLRLQLEGHGMHCVDVPDAREALARVGAGMVFDVAVLDQYMPDMDGPELARELRLLPAGRELPLVLLSSMAWKPPAGVEPLFAAVLCKPARSAALLDRVATALGIAPAVPAPEAGRRRSGDEGHGAGDPLRILLAEDNVVNQQVAQIMVRRLGHRVDTVSNGREALEAALRIPYDVVLMDVQMPVMDGLEATRLLRAQLPRDRQPRIVALTANVLVEDRVACERAGMDDYLAKPVRSTALRSALTATQAPGRPAAAVPDPASASADDLGEQHRAILERLDDLRGPDPEEDRLLFGDVIASFLSRVPEALAGVQRAVDAGDADLLRSTAHSVKGSAGNLGGGAVVDLSGRLEAQGRGGRVESSAPDLVRKLEIALRDFQHALRTLAY